MWSDLRERPGGAPGRHGCAEALCALRSVAAGAIPAWCLLLIVQIQLAPGRPLDWPVFAGVPAVLFPVAAVATWLPAQRAAAVDPGGRVTRGVSGRLRRALKGEASGRSESA